MMHDLGIHREIDLGMCSHRRLVQVPAQEGGRGFYRGERQAGGRAARNKESVSLYWPGKKQVRLPVGLCYPCWQEGAPFWSPCSYLVEVPAY